MFTSKSTRDKIVSIHEDSRNHAAIVQNVINKHQTEGTEPSKGIIQSMVRHVATTNITAMMLLCIDNDVPLSDVRNMLNLDGLVEADDPQAMLDDLASIEHLDFSFDPNETDQQEG